GLRWWLNGLRFGEARVSTDLRTMQIYGAYLRYIGWSMLVIIAAIGPVAVIALVGAAIMKGAGVTADSGQVIAAVTGFVAYVALALCIWIVYQVTVRLRIWRAMVDSVQITGFEAVESVRADLTRPTSALGEGLVDALGAGGMSPPQAFGGHPEIRPDCRNRCSRWLDVTRLGTLRLRPTRTGAT